MFAHLKGVVAALADNHLVIDVGGVGYLVFAPRRSLASLALGQAVTFYIETVVREDAILLYGFDSLEQKKMFQLLTTVQGVGNKIALAFLDALQPQDIALAIMAGDNARLLMVTGVGGKLASRIIQELQDKVIKQGEQWTGSPTMGGNNMMADILSALEQLGFQKSEAMPQVTELLRHPDNEGKTLEQILPLALGVLGRLR